MKITIEIDLRKSNPLGLDLDFARHHADTCYDKARRMGHGDKSRAGYVEHEWERGRLLDEARKIHSLLLILSDLLGTEATQSIEALRWAASHDYHGNKKPQF